jgi:hypothetical protein
MQPLAVTCKSEVYACIWESHSGNYEELRLLGLLVDTEDGYSAALPTK